MTVRSRPGEHYPWFRLYSTGWLTGSVRTDLSLGERAVWVDLLAMASESRVRGVICRAPGIAYNLEHLAMWLEIPADVLHSTIEKCVTEGRLRIEPDGCMTITNWNEYQNTAKRDKAETKGDIPMALEDKRAGQQAAAARLAYMHPDAARRGIEQNETDRQHKESVKRLGKGDTDDG